MSELRYASVCDGIGAAHQAWHSLGWRCAWTSEIEPFPSAVVEHHWNLPNVGDMLNITEKSVERYGPIELLAGGTPCQSFSVAGLRGGLDDPRGNLSLRFLQLAGFLRPRWLVWENVPGVLSSNGGRDFGSIIGGMAQLGYGWAYRILDAQYVRVDSHARAVPQRRWRVFVVGHLGDWRRAAAVLFERACLSGHPPPSREAGQRVAASLTRGADSSGRGGYAGRRREDDVNVVAGTVQANYADKWGLDNQHVDAGCPNFIAFDTTQITSKGNYSNPKPGDACHPLAEGAHAPAVAFNHHKGGSDKSTLGTYEEHTAAMRSDSKSPFAVAVDEYNAAEGEACHTLAGDGRPDRVGSVRSGLTVRRLTPIECERLQGYPDHYTAITYRGKPAADGPRYRALGNSWAVNVARWIGLRIEQVEATNQ